MAGLHSSTDSADVAQLVDVVVTSISYYFMADQQLPTFCFSAGLVLRKYFCVYSEIVAVG